MDENFQKFERIVFDSLKETNLENIDYSPIVKKLYYFKGNL